MSTKEDKKVLLSVSLLEAAMIKKMRRFPFSTIRVVRLDGEPKKVFIEGSENLSEDDGLTFYIEEQNSYTKVKIENNVPKK